VFFRSADLPSAAAYRAVMLGVGQPQAGAGLIASLIYDPYYVAIFTAACAIAFAGPQTWDWTRRITLPKVAACAAGFWAALLLLETQSYNPFIYFIF
jgi:alginate O-acetyltransferase complex protein AlgI